MAEMLSLPHKLLKCGPHSWKNWIPDQNCLNSNALQKWTKFDPTYAELV